MSLTDPREAFAEESAFIDYLVGLAGLGRLVRTLADADRRGGDPGDADDFVDLLVGVAGLGSAIESLADSVGVQRDRDVESASERSESRWLR